MTTLARGGDAGTVALTILILAVAVASVAWHYHRSRALLEAWAAENSYRIVWSEHRHLFRGPFFWTTSKGQTVYRVTVQDAEGSSRSGWVRCGGWVVGLFSDKVQVRWDDEA